MSHNAQTTKRDFISHLNEVLIFLPLGELRDRLEEALLKYNKATHIDGTNHDNFNQRPKIIQISMAHNNALYALRDDGTIWRFGDYKKQWIKIPEIPLRRSLND